MKERKLRMSKKAILGKIRRDIDFKFMPQLLFDDPANFINGMEIGKEEFLCMIFNEYHKGINEKVFKNNPIVFKPEDFKITKYMLAKSKFMYYIELPKVEESVLWTEAYGIAFDLKIAVESEIKFFTVEKSINNPYVLYGVAPDLTHFSYHQVLESADNIEDNAERMLKIMFKY